MLLQLEYDGDTTVDARDNIIASTGEKIKART